MEGVETRRCGAISPRNTPPTPGAARRSKDIVQGTGFIVGGQPWPPRRRAAHRKLFYPFPPPPNPFHSPRATLFNLLSRLQGRIDVLWADRGGGAHVAGILMIIYGVYLLYPKKR